jgi:RNA polymerase sigma-54 factor
MEQRLIQSPQMIQAMKILQLGTLDLRERIDQELVENPMLEEATDPAEERTKSPEDEGLEESALQRETKSDTDQEEVLRMLDVLERIERDLGEGNRSTSSDGEEGDRKLQALANAPSVPKTMAEALSEELAFIELSRRKRAIAEFLIFSLDERGYLSEDLETLAAECPIADTLQGGNPEDTSEDSEQGVAEQAEPAPPQPHPTAQSNGTDSPQEAEPAAEGDLDLPESEPLVSADGPVTVEELRWVLDRLRGLIHPALGAHDLREALLLQLEHLEGEQPILRSIIENHLEDVQNNRLPRIAKATGQSIETIQEVLEHLRRLDPAPAAEYGESVATIIAPDVMVQEDEGEYRVSLERARIPRLQLSPTYRKLLEESKKGDGTQAWLKKRLESARWFIDAITQRQSTLERIAGVIFKRQQPFLERGLTALQPLRMQEVADEVHVHISTVSRAVSGKYAQTPRGIFPLKFFFSGGTKKETGEVASQVSIQQRMKELVAREDRKKPLSDEEIAALLKERDNIQIARRTVSKYRKMLGIPSSSQRRTY